MLYSKDYSYNKNLYLRESHNCYNYFLNLKSRVAYESCKNGFYKKNKFCKRPQPGYAAGLKEMEREDYNCNTMMYRTLKDNPKMIKINKTQKCNKDFYKGALVVAPNRDFHYYRLNDDGIWTHKPGYKPSTQYDASGKLIHDPEKADRNYGGTLHYKDFCGYVCIPRDRSKKTMKMLNKTTR